MRPALFTMIALSALALPLCAQTQEDSPLVRAAKAASTPKKHSTMPVITNDTLARTGGHMATTDSIKEIPPVAQVDNTVPPKNGTRVATAAEHLASPPAPAYSAGSMTPAQPAMVSTQAVPVSPAATGLKPASTGYPAMVSTQALPQSVSTPARPPQP